MINIKKYRISKALLLLLIIFISTVGHVNAQKEEFKLIGSVKDTFGHELPGATIACPETAISSVVSGLDGSFTIKGKLLENQLMIISLNGYKSKEINYKEEEGLNIVLESDVSGRDNTVSLLSGDRTMSTVGASAATISADVLSRTKGVSLGTALTGRLPGYASGFIRGKSTTNGDSPTIMVDGMVTDTYGHLNLNDVESVTILKDAIATSLYGFQGANGIISVKTKKGYNGEATINVTANYTMEKSMVNPTVLNSAQYATLYNEAWANDGNSGIIYSDSDIAQYASGENRDLYPNNNWYDMFIDPLVETENVHVSGRGGSEKIKYYVGMGYLHQDSPYITDGTVSETYGTTRYDIRSNLDVKINDYITAYMNLGANINSYTNTQSGSIYSSIFNQPPTVYGPTTPEGNVIITETDATSVYALINRSGYQRTTTSQITSLSGLDIDLKKILPGLSAGGELMYYSIPISFITGDTDYARYVRDGAVTDSLAFVQYGANEEEPITLSKSVYTSYRTQLQANLKYINTFGDHGVSANTFIQKQFYSSFDTSDEAIEPYIKMTYGLNMSYAYKNLFYADFVYGLQGSEQFNSGSRYGLFPSMSTALVLSNYDFLKNNKTVSFLKIRGSYGLTGNDNLGTSDRYLYKDNLTTGTTISEDRLGNPNITWETSRIANIGFDLGLWDQVSLSFEYFDDQRTDILVSNQLYPAMSGISSSSLPLMNAGEVHSYGFEALLGYQKNITKDFSLGFNGYFAFNDNEVVEAAELYQGDDYAYPYTTTGYRVGQQWGYLIDYSNGNGFFNSDSEIAASGLTYDGTAPRAGDFIYQDLNDDGIIDDKDIAPMGYSSIPRISYSGEINMQWKNFDLSALVYGVSQVNSFNSGAGYYESYSGGTFFTQHLKAWTPERYANGEEITAPALSLNGSSSNKANNYYFQDKSYLQLREVTLGYSIPDTWSNKIGSKDTRVYFSGRNLFYLDNMKSDDQTVAMSGVNVAPTRRSFVFGLNLTF
jgi:TonB-linked SusC/RagA family outer membrane protein